MKSDGTSKLASPPLSSPTELASVETGLCTTSKTRVVQKPENHRGKLGGVWDNRFRPSHREPTRRSRRETQGVLEGVGV
jgi:hypothetical protein